MHSHWLIYVTRLTASNCNSLLQSFTSNYSTVKILFEIGCKVTYLTTFLRTVTLNYFLFEFPNKETGNSLLETPLGRAHNGTSQYGPFPYELDFSLDLHRYLVYPNLPRAKLRHTLEMFFEENLDFLEVWAFKLVWKRRHIFRPSNNGSHTRHPTENEWANKGFLYLVFNVRETTSCAQESKKERRPSSSFFNSLLPKKISFWCELGTLALSLSLSYSLYEKHSSVLFNREALPHKNYTIISVWHFQYCSQHLPTYR